MKLRRKLPIALAAAAVPAALMVMPAAASASYGPGAVYQVALSDNCNNVSFCGSNLGGDWGWAVFNANGTGELQATFCFHLLGGPGGAGHEDVDIYAWSVDQQTGMLAIDKASDPSFVGDTPIPAAPGHYSFHPAPGVAAEIQVTKLPNT